MGESPRRIQIGQEFFSIEKGWLLFDGPSLRIDGISSVTVLRNAEDFDLEMLLKEQKPGPLTAGCSVAVGVFVILFLATALLGNIHYVEKLLRPATASLFALYIVLALSAGVSAAWSEARRKPRTNVYELLIDTKSGTGFYLVSTHTDYLFRVKRAIEEAISSQNQSTSYHFNVSAQTIEKIDANVNQLINSPGAAVIGGSASNVSQNTNVIMQGMQDVAQLAALLEQSNAANKAFMADCLEIVRNHLAGGASSKADAKSAWQKFIANVGGLAGTSNQVWELIGRIAGLLG